MFGVLRYKKGFTLVELIVVVVIVGILASVAIPMMSSSINKAKKSEGVAGLGTIRTAARLYAAENNGTYPAGLANINSYVTTADLNGKYYAGSDYGLATNVAYANNANSGNVSMNVVDGNITGY
jgi:type IV pilus assembly protein PilA